MERDEFFEQLNVDESCQEHYSAENIIWSLELEENLEKRFSSWVKDVDC